MGKKRGDAINGDSDSSSADKSGRVIEETGNTHAVASAGWPPQRPSLHRDISHELEFSTSFVSRKPNVKKNSLACPPTAPVSEQRQSLTDDLVKRAHAQRFLLGARKIQAEEQKQPTVVRNIDPAPVTSSKMFRRRASSSNSLTSAIRDLLASDKVEEEAEEGEDASLESASICSDTAISRDTCSPSEVSFSILNQDQELTTLDKEAEEKEQVKTMERRLNRARKLRRTTVMHYDQQEDTFRRRRAPQLFELAVLIDLEPNDGSNEKLFPLDQYSYVPKVSFVYPSRPPQNLQPLLATLPPLCYADLGRARPQDPERYKDEQFLMIITDTSGDRKYAYCHRFVQLDFSKYASENGQAIACSTESDSTNELNGAQADQSQHVLPQILCIVTPVNASSFYFDLAHEAALRAKSGNMKMLITFLRQSFRQRLPAPNGFVTVKLVDDEAVEESAEGADTGWEVVLVNRTTPKKGQGLGELLDRLGVDLLMKLFCALLCEKRVLFVADSVPVLSRSVQAASTMLAPFEWPHTLIPVIPDPFLHLCYSPVPYLMGVLRDHLPSLQTLLQDDETDVENQEEYMLILDVDKASVLKDKDWATNTPLGPIDLFTASPKLLPNRITRSLKQLLKSAIKSEDKKREQKTTDAFQWTFVELVGHYREHVKIDVNQPEFVRESFLTTPTSRSQRNFLKWFVETGMFQVWINKKLDTWATSQGGRPVIVDPFDKKLDHLKAAASDVRGWSWARF